MQTFVQHVFFLIDVQSFPFSMSYRLLLYVFIVNYYIIMICTRKDPYLFYLLSPPLCYSFIISPSCIETYFTT